MTTYSAWVAVTWDFTGATVTSARLASAPSGLDPAFSATDANGDQVYNTLSAVNVTPANCSVANTTYCTYRAYLDVVLPAAPLGRDRGRRPAVSSWSAGPRSSRVAGDHVVHRDGNPRRVIRSGCDGDGEPSGDECPDRPSAAADDVCDHRHEL